MTDNQKEKNQEPNTSKPEDEELLVSYEEEEKETKPKFDNEFIKNVL